MLNKLTQSAVIFAALFLLVSCGASKKNHAERLILQGVNDSIESVIPNLVPTIKKGDLLTILIFSDNIEATALYNQSQGGAIGATASAGGAALAATGRGYQVNENGQIYFQNLGLINVEGKSTAQLSEYLRESLKPFLLNPYANVRFANARVTVLGEVAKPGIIDIPNQKMSILDALGFSGDLTPFSRRDNILVVRENNGRRITGRLDLRSADVYASPFFYLQQNDMVYVEPNRKKPTGNEQVLMRNITITTSIISVVAVLATLLTR